MKRGRPSKRRTIRENILKILRNSSVPLTTSAMSRIMSEEHGTDASWNTVQKYIRELVESNKIEPIHLPHSKKSGETGLVVYSLKR